MAEKEEEELDIKDISQNLEIDNVNINFSDLDSERPSSVSFSPAFNEALEELDETVDFSSTENVSKTVIESNTGYNDTMREVTTMGAALGLQPPSPHAADVNPRDADLMNQSSAAFPSEMETEKLPPNMGGATPRPSRGIQSLRATSANLKDSGKYGFA
tara:strand:- start:415 stop:891 length:477 start_codon:yes stop_codon:yes gene_type:complete